MPVSKKRAIPGRKRRGTPKKVKWTEYWLKPNNFSAERILFCQRVHRKATRPKKTRSIAVRP